MEERDQIEVQRTLPSSTGGGPLRMGESVRRDAARRGSPTNVDNYRDDSLYPRISSAVATILAKGKVVAPVDVLIAMKLLAPQKLEDWRRGRVPYLERRRYDEAVRD